MLPKAEEEHLIAKVIAGDQQAMVDLAERYRPLLLKTLRGHGIADQECSDVLQDVLSAAFSQIKRNLFRGDSSLGTWLSTIARGKVADYRKSAFQRAQSLTDSIEESAPGDVVAPALTIAAKHDMNFEVRRALELLSSQERVILKLKEMDGYTVKEIGKISGLPEKQIYSLLEKARKNFRRVISGQRTGGSRLIE